MYLELLDVVVVNVVKEATMAFVRYYVGDVVKMKNHILVVVMNGKFVVLVLTLP